MVTPTLKEVADASWLKLVERLALPIIAAVLWAQWQALETIKLQVPNLQTRVERLETFEKDTMILRAKITEIRGNQFEEIQTRLTRLEAGLEGAARSQQDIKADLKEIARSLQNRP